MARKLIYWFCFVYFFYGFNVTLLSRQETGNTPQSDKIHKKKNNHITTHNIKLKKGVESNFLLTRDGQPHIIETDLTEKLRIIVEFKGQPLVKIIGADRQQRLAKRASYQTLFSRFENDLQIMQQAASNKYPSIQATAQVERQFTIAFLGASLNVPRALLNKIQKLDYVKRIHYDNEVKAFVNESIGIIRADSVWKKYGTQGEDIRIGILDTGIDYNHSDLGEGFKVVGGYDYVNGDEDPMDDHGHGTYIAGIAAADGDSLRGVAPKAQLYAYKVLTHNGSGWNSNIITAIGRTLDPNQDGDFSDRLDIVNMSLGGFGNPDDAMSIAVDNAVRAGVTFCIASGNGIPQFQGYNAISSPGTARLAITVGASHKQGKVADFSMKGPNISIATIKPEVVAPGVDIHSLFLHGGYRSADGTSPATAFISGVAALLKSLHPGWQPTQIKSALMTSAVDLGEDVMAQGSGRIDAFAAAETGVIVEPAHLSFGMIDVSLEQVQVADTLLFKNTSSQQQEIDLNFTGLQSGIALNSSPGRFTLEPGDSLNVVVDLSVTNALVPSPSERSLSYGGFMDFASETQRGHIPWAFVKAAKVTLTLDLPQNSFAVTNKNKTILDGLNSTRIDPYTVEFITPSGTYDLFSQFRGDSLKIVIKENISIDGLMNIAVSAQDAQHRLLLKGVNENGEPFSSMEGAQKNYIFLFPDSLNMYIWGFYRFSDKPVYVSDVSDRYLIGTGEFHDSVENEATVRIIQHMPLNGIVNDKTLVNSASDFIAQNIGLDFSPVSKNRVISFPNSVTGISIGTSIYNFEGTWDQYYPVNSLSWRGKLFMTPNVSEKYRFSVGGHAQNKNDFYDWIDTPTFFPIKDSIGCITGVWPTSISWFSPSGETMIFGKAPIHA